MLLIVVDEFGKVLEYAAKNSIEKELSFYSSWRVVNVPLLPEYSSASVSTSNFNTYASKA